MGGFRDQGVETVGLGLCKVEELDLDPTPPLDLVFCSEDHLGKGAVLGGSIASSSPDLARQKILIMKNGGKLFNGLTPH